MLAVAALLGPLEQASLHTSASLNKHTDLGAWFAAIAAGYAADAFIAAAPAGRSRLLTTAGCVLALAFPAFFGFIQSWSFATAWPNSASFVAILRPLAAHGNLLVETPGPARYYLPSGQPVAALVVHPQHRPAQRGQHRRPGPGRRGGGREPGAVRPVHQPGLLLDRGAELQRHHRAGPADPRRPGPQPLPHHPGRAVQPAGHQRHRRDRHLRHLAIQGTATVTTTRDTPRPPAGRAAFAPRPAGRTRLVLPQPPDDTEKYSYLQRNLPFLTTTIVISAACLTISQIRFELHDTAMWPFMVFTATYVLYLLTGLPVNFTGRGFNFAAHEARIAAWHPSRYPDVDIFLPICGEPIEVLHNTWTAVAGLLAAYPGAAQAFVLDDGPSDEAQALAADIGLSYIRRPGQRVHKKAGNLRYAFARTSSEFIVIFDADFAPRPDFLAETLPYLDDPELGIVVTPQYFRQSPEQTWIENAAGAIQEVFYRSIQVSRDRFGAAICTGTSSVYRRVALEPVKGATLIPYAEDVHTGLDVRLAGWSIRYVPLLLSTGICPDNLDSFVRQQYRWCTGNAGIVFSHRLWGIRMSVAARLTFLSGFFYYAYTGLLNFVGPLIPVIMLAFLPGQIRLRNFVILLPAAFAGFVLYALWHRSGYRPSVWPLGIARGWAHVFALWDGAWGKTMSWHPSRTPGSSLRRFRLAVTWWSGGMAVLWVLLAIWRSVTPGSVQFAVLLGFGLLNLAVVGRVIFPGRNAA